MIGNRSVPTNTILPHVIYQDLPAAIDWLTHTFGFTEHYRYGDPVSGAQMHLGNAWIMVRLCVPWPSWAGVEYPGLVWLTMIHALPRCICAPLTGSP